MAALASLFTRKENTSNGSLIGSVDKQVNTILGEWRCKQPPPTEKELLIDFRTMRASENEPCVSSFLKRNANTVLRDARSQRQLALTLGRLIDTLLEEISCYDVPNEACFGLLSSTELFCDPPSISELQKAGVILNSCIVRLLEVFPSLPCNLKLKTIALMNRLPSKGNPSMSTVFANRPDLAVRLLEVRGYEAAGLATILPVLNHGHIDTMNSLFYSGNLMGAICRAIAAAPLIARDIAPVCIQATFIALNNIEAADNQLYTTIMRPYADHVLFSSDCSLRLTGGSLLFEFLCEERNRSWLHRFITDSRLTEQLGRRFLSVSAPGEEVLCVFHLAKLIWHNPRKSAEIRQVLLRQRLDLLLRLGSLWRLFVEDSELLSDRGKVMSALKELV